MSSFDGIQWCRACGAIVPQQTHSCERCGIDLAPLDRADYDIGSRIGQVVSVGKLLKKPAVVIAERPDVVTLVSKGEDQVDIIADLEQALAAG